MGATLKTKTRRAKVLAREDAARLLNSAAQSHVIFSQLVVPRDTDALMNSIKQGDEATPENLRTTVTAGNEEVDYAAPQEYGFTHHLSGERIPGHFYFAQGLELGQQKLVNHKVRLNG